MLGNAAETLRQDAVEKRDCNLKKKKRSTQRVFFPRDEQQRTGVKPKQTRRPDCGSQSAAVAAN